jgi:antitoxin HicB
MRRPVYRVEDIERGLTGDVVFCGAAAVDDADSDSGVLHHEATACHAAPRSIPDLPGCIADGQTVEQAISEARDAWRAWMTAELEDKGEAPAPRTYSGQFVQRIPKSLHMRLARRAESEGVSLNQLATTLLAEGLGRR